MAKYRNIKEAAQAWVSEFTAVPYSVVEKLVKYSDFDDITEITVPTVGDSVCVGYKEGEIVSVSQNLEKYRVDFGDDTEDVCIWEIEITDRDYLPMWGTMWAVPEIDSEWFENNLQIVGNCGFRIYNSEDYGYLIGIDGAGYDFYEEHWIPLYMARGFHWHDED